MTAGRLAGLAASAIVVLWGGVLVIAAIERRLPDAQQWYGHAAVHLWTAAIAWAIAWVGFITLRDHRLPTRALRWSVAAVVAVASFTSVANVLDAVGAYPSLRTFHDRVNAVAAPAGWLLLLVLLVLVVVASAIAFRTSTTHAHDGQA
jgi:hypothetical protein